MLNRLLRATMTKILAPVAHLFLRLGISPDVVTVVGTVGVCVGALAFFPRGEIWVGCLVITAFVFSDTVDGIMARESGRSSKWGAYLDSTLDRMGDAAIFGGLVLYYAGPGDNRWMAGLALACLILGSVVSYAKARAEGLGYTAERRHRRAGRPARRRARWRPSSPTSSTRRCCSASCWACSPSRASSPCCSAC